MSEARREEVIRFVNALIELNNLAFQIKSTFLDAGLSFCPGMCEKEILVFQCVPQIAEALDLSYETKPYHAEPFNKQRIVRYKGYKIFEMGMDENGV